jgi:hypothetical protein
MDTAGLEPHALDQRAVSERQVGERDAVVSRRPLPRVLEPYGTLSATYTPGRAFSATA